MRIMLDLLIAEEWRWLIQELLLLHGELIECLDQYLFYAVDVHSFDLCQHTLYCSKYMLAFFVFLLLQTLNAFQE
jgi:hypothetical protein